MGKEEPPPPPPPPQAQGEMRRTKAGRKRRNEDRMGRVVVVVIVIDFFFFFFLFFAAHSLFAHQRKKNIACTKYKCLRMYKQCQPLAPTIQHCMSVPASCHQILPHQQSRCHVWTSGTYYLPTDRTKSFASVCHATRRAIQSDVGSASMQR